MDAFVVYGSGVLDDGWDTIGIFLDIDKGKEFIKSKNTEREAEQELVNMCSKCTDDDYGNGENTFKLKSTCDRCCMKKDRHGIYCENEIQQYDIKSLYYSGETVKIME